MSKKILFIVGTLVILISLPLSVFLVRQKQEIRMKAASATVLSLSPTTETKEVGGTFMVNILINTGTNSVVSADLDLNFNPQILEVLTLSPGSFFLNPQEPTKLTNNETGKIQYSLFSLTAKQGTGILASLAFRGKSPGRSQIIFDPTTTVGGIGETEALSSTSPGSYTIIAIAGPTVTPTPGPTATPTSTPKPTITPTSGPTATPTPTPMTVGLGESPTPTPTPKPTLVPTIKPTPTPTPVMPVTGTLNSTVFFILGGLLFLIVGVKVAFLR